MMAASQTELDTNLSEKEIFKLYIDAGMSRYDAELSAHISNSDRQLRIDILNQE